MKPFSISATAIDLAAFRRQLKDTACGAYVVFEGWVRDQNEGRAVEGLEYEVYEPLAIKEGEAVIAEALQKFPILHACAIHRQGELALSEPAVVVGVSSAHRGAAFDACRFIIDEVKVRLPIWKRESYVDGTREWVNCKACSDAGGRHAEHQHA